MTEEFLHYIWRYKLYDPDPCLSTGESVYIINTGTYNIDAGPDFFNALIRINGTTWAGNIEIHIKSSDWYRHNHHHNPAYDNIILHVVYENDDQICRANGEQVPCLILRNQFNQKLFSMYNHLIHNNNWIPCDGLIDLVDQVKIKNWFDRIVIERLERKSINIQQILTQNHYDWQNAMFITFCSGFGFKINTLPFELLAKSLDVKIILKHSNNLAAIEALLFGQAGFLEDEFTDLYLINLKNEYNHFKHKYNLVPLEKHLWKFLRMRPMNFPTVRIAQLSTILFNIKNISALFTDAVDLKMIYELMTVDVSPYWESHYMPGKLSQNKSKKLTRLSINNILVNAVAPFIFTIGLVKKQDSQIDNAIELLARIDPERNSIISKFKALGLSTTSASETQALLELRKFYCQPKRCLHCAIGNEILKMSTNLINSE